MNSEKTQFPIRDENAVQPRNSSDNKIVKAWKFTHLKAILRFNLQTTHLAPSFLTTGFCSNYSMVHTVEVNTQ